MTDENKEIRRLKRLDKILLVGCLTMMPIAGISQITRHYDLAKISAVAGAAAAFTKIGMAIGKYDNALNHSDYKSEDNNYNTTNNN